MNRKGYNLENVVKLFVLNLLKEDISEKEKNEFNNVIREKYLLNNTKDLTDPNYIYSKLSEAPRYDSLSAFDRFKTTVSFTNKRTLRRRMTRSVAAIVIPMLIIGGVLAYLYNSDYAQVSSLADAIEIKPLNSSVYMVRSDGNTIDLSHSDTTKCPDLIITNQGALKCTQITPSQLNDVPVEVYDEVIVPRGMEHIMILSDGTQVWINADSRLRFPTQFGAKKREVYISGEAYFSVTKDSTRQFVVHTSRGDIEVIGTEFNISDYDDNNTLIMTLLEGSVQYRRSSANAATVIKPGEQLNVTDSDFSIVNVDTREYVAWRNGSYVFCEETLYNIMKNIERRYDVVVVFAEESLKNLRFSGETERYSNIDLFLRFIEISGDVKFTIDNKLIIVTKK